MRRGKGTALAALVRERLPDPDIARSKRGEPPSGTRERLERRLCDNSRTPSVAVAAVRGPRPRKAAPQGLSWLLGIAVVVGLLALLGVDVAGWFSDLWDALTGIGLGYLLAGWSLQTVQTTLTALGWYFILRAAYPRAPAPYRQVLAAYAAGVALNGFLPANIGTFVMLLMFVAITPGANFAGVVGGMLVQKIFFTLVGAFVYVYLFATVPGTFERQFELPHDHPLLMLAIVAGARAADRRPRCASSGASCPGWCRRPSRAAPSSRARASTCCGWRCRHSVRGWPSSA